MKKRYWTLSACLVLAGCGGNPATSTDGGNNLGSAGSSGSSGASGPGDGGDSSQGTGGLMIGTGGSSGSTGTGGGPLGISDACVTDSGEARRTPLDIALLVDTSYSMDFDFKWQQVSGALLTFASAPRFRDLGVALQFFPARAQCSVSAYGTPVVPMSELPGAEPQIDEAVGAQRMFGGTPLVQVLQGMGGYVRAWAKAHADRKAVVVLATDGIPDDICTSSDFMPPNGLDGAASIAKDLATSADIPVFVIGVGKELGALDAIADAGGTQSALLVDVGGNVQQQFLDALDGIRRRSVSCQFDIPASMSGKIDYSQVNVELSRPGKRAELLYSVDSAASCDDKPTAAWYYDDPKNPGKVVLCPDTCSRFAGYDAAKIDVLFGCERVVVVK